MSNISEKIAGALDSARKEWDTRIGNKREQGNYMVTNMPSFLTSDHSWVGSLKEKLVKDEWVKAIETYINKSLEGRADNSDLIAEINTGLSDLGLEKIEDIEDMNEAVNASLAWLKDTNSSLGLGSKYKIEYEVTSAVPESSDSVVENNVEELEEKGENDVKEAKNTPDVICVSIKNEAGEVVYTNSTNVSKKSGTEDVENNAKANTPIVTDENAINFGRSLAGFHTYSSIDSSAIAKIFVDRDETLKEFERVMGVVEDTKAEFDKFLTEHKKEGTQSSISLEVKGFSSGESEETAPTVEGLTQDQQTLYNSLYKKQFIVSEIFSNQSVENANALVSLVRRSLVSNLRALKESYVTLDSMIQEEQKIVSNVDSIVDTLESKISELNTQEEVTGADQDAGQENSGEEQAEAVPAVNAESQKEESIKIINEQIDLVNRARDIRSSYIEFIDSIREIDQYAQFLSGMSESSTSTLTWTKSLFDSRRAIAKPMIAVALSAITAGAAAAIAPASAVLYTISVALSAYASGRFAAIYSMSRRHGVKMSDLHTNAMHYSSRVEVAATVIPVVASIVAPFALAANIATQVLSYCGSVAMRAVYSVAASVTVNAFEVSRDTANSPTPVDQSSFVARARETALNAERIPETVLNQVNNYLKSKKIELVQAANVVNDEGESTPGNLPDNVKSMNEIATKANQGNLEAKDFTTLKGLLKIDIKTDAQYTEIAKLPVLLKSLNSIQSLAKNQHTAFEARQRADQNSADERISFAHNISAQ